MLVALSCDTDELSESCARAHAQGLAMGQHIATICLGRKNFHIAYGQNLSLE